MFLRTRPSLLESQAASKADRLVIGGAHKEGRAFEYSLPNLARNLRCDWLI